MSTPDEDKLDWSRLVGPADRPVPGEATGPKVHPWFHRGPRPGEVTFAALALGVIGLLRLVLVLWLLLAYGSDLPGLIFFLSIVDLCLAGTLIACAVGVYRGSQTARITAITISVINVAVGTISLLLGGSGLTVVGIVINVVVITLLNRYYVKEWCR